MNYEHAMAWYLVAGASIFTTLAIYANSQYKRLSSHRYAWQQARELRMARYKAKQAAIAGGYGLCPRCKLEPTEGSMCQWCAI